MKSFSMLVAAVLVSISVQVVADTGEQAQKKPLAASSVAIAKTLADVPVPKTLVMENHKLILNGAGIRTKFFMDMYVGSLYTDKKTHNAAEVLNSKSPVAVQLDIISRLISSEKMADAVEDGFKKATNNNVAPYRDRLNSFIAVFSKEAIKKGDHFTLMMIPEKGLDVFKNGQKLTHVKGDDFSKTLLSVWLGKNPMDSGLKKAMLNG